MARISLKKQIESLKPLNSKLKIDELISLMKERNSSIDCYLDKWICSQIGDSSLVDYYKTKRVYIKRINPATDTMPYLAELLVNYYPVDTVSKVDKIYDEFTKEDRLLNQKDFDFASGIIVGKKGKQQWKKRYNEGREIKLQVDTVNTKTIIAVPQPLASLLVSGSIKEIKIDNYYTLHKGDTIYVYANGYSSEMMNKIKYNLNIWSNFCNGIFTGSYQEDAFLENCYIGKFDIGEKNLRVLKK